MIVLTVECNSSRETIIDAPFAMLLRQAGINVEAADITFMNLRTKQGTLAYMLQDGLDGPEHVFKWVDNHERLTGELKCSTLLSRGPGYTVHTSKKPAANSASIDFQDSEL